MPPGVPVPIPAPADRVAILVDGDNLCSTHAASLLRIADRAGRADILRVYADGLRRPGWRVAPGFRFLDAGSGKNVADLLLCIDAVEIALSGAIKTVVLASGDGDFTHLVLRLRERGLVVIGVGSAGASRALAACCSRFEVVETGATVAPVIIPPPAQADPLDLGREAVAMIRAHGGHMTVARLSNEMWKAHDVRISDRTEKSWRGFLQGQPTLFDIDPKGPDAMVRLRPGGRQMTLSAPCRDRRTSPPPAPEPTPGPAPRCRRAAP